MAFHGIVFTLTGQADMAVSSSVGSNIFDILVTWTAWILFSHSVIPWLFLLVVPHWSSI